jgi:hypothetical protein
MAGGRRGFHTGAAARLCGRARRSSQWQHRRPGRDSVRGSHRGGGHTTPAYHCTVRHPVPGPCSWRTAAAGCSCTGVTRHGADPAADRLLRPGRGGAHAGRRQRQLDGRGLPGRRAHRGQLRRRLWGGGGAPASAAAACGRDDGGRCGGSGWGSGRLSCRGGCRGSGCLAVDVGGGVGNAVPWGVDLPAHLCRPGARADCARAAVRALMCCSAERTHQGGARAHGVDAPGDALPARPRRLPDSRPNLIRAPAARLRRGRFALGFETCRGIGPWEYFKG